MMIKEFPQGASDNLKSDNIYVLRTGSLFPPLCRKHQQSLTLVSTVTHFLTSSPAKHQQSTCVAQSSSPWLLPPSPPRLLVLRSSPLLLLLSPHPSSTPSPTPSLLSARAWPTWSETLLTSVLTPLVSFEQLRKETCLIDRNGVLTVRVQVLVLKSLVVLLLLAWLVLRVSSVSLLILPRPIVFKQVTDKPHSCYVQPFRRRCSGYRCWHCGYR